MGRKFPAKLRLRQRFLWSPAVLTPLTDQPDAHVMVSHSLNARKREIEGRTGWMTVLAIRYTLVSNDLEFLPGTEDA